MSLPSLSHLSLRSISAKHDRESEAEPDAKKRITFYDSISSKTVYRGASGENSLERCLDGGHFSWLEDTAEDYATTGVSNRFPGYVIHTNPLCLYLRGATFHHGAQWNYYYATFRVDNEDEPDHWDEMLELVGQWQEAMMLGQTLETVQGDVPLLRTKYGFLRTLYWKKPDASVDALLKEFKFPRDVVDWDSENAALVHAWKTMVHAAIKAAPWHIDGPSTSEFVVDGCDLTYCIDKVVEYAPDADDPEIVYERTSPSGSSQSMLDFRRWFIDTS